MAEVTIQDIDFVDVDLAMAARLRREWGERVEEELHVYDGISIVATHRGAIVGLASLRCDELPAPLGSTREGYIDIVEVREPYRRKGMARTLVELTVSRARAAHRDHA